MEQYTKLLKVKALDIDAGKLISVMDRRTAGELGILPLDRISIKNRKNGKKATTVVDFTESMVGRGEIGTFKDVSHALGAKTGAEVEVAVVGRPKSVEYIREKLDGKNLNYKQIKEIVDDLAANRLSEVEASAFVSAIYINGFDLSESVSMTKALVEDGERLKFKGKILDKHSVGGTNGRVTMVVVPIIAAAGYKIPKTSSRSITSSAGTADAMEVLCNVSLSLKKMKRITEKVGGVIAWGGAVDLAPADDLIIKIEHPLSLDPEGQVIASVMAKKASVGAKYVVIDLPVGPDVKVKTKEKAKGMADKFIAVGKGLGIKVQVILTDGTEPCGMAFGPALEAKWVMEILEGKRFDDVADKSCALAGALLEMAGGAKKGWGYAKAKDLLDSGKALKKMKQIIRAQGGKITESSQIVLAKKKVQVRAKMEGEISKVNIRKLNKIARLAGAPADKRAGIMLNVKEGDKIERGALLMEIYGKDERRLEIAKKYAETRAPIELERMVIGRYS